MNAWGAALLALVVALVPLVARGWRGDPFDRLAAQQAVMLVVAFATVVFAQLVGQSTMVPVALVLVTLGLPSALIFARYYERWL